MERFLREAKAAARLNHPHIVPVYDAGRDGKLNYIASAFIDGQPLAAMIEQLAGDFRRIATLIRQLAEALDYAHSQGVIHRDVKPDNVMIDSAGQPHLMDFGLARIGDAAQKLTHDGTVMGTPAYMSPEQACDDPSAVTHASDQYSLGVVLYELLTGDTPFSGPPAIIIFNVLNQPIPAPRSLRADLPSDLETICLKATAKEPERRYGSCREFAEDLRRWLVGEPITARRVSQTERLLRWCRRNPVVATLIATVVLLSLTGTTVTAILWGQAATAANQAKQANNDLQKRQSELVEATEHAEKSATDAKQAAESERRAKEDIRHKAYASEINRAQHTVEIGDVAYARRILEGLVPSDGEDDLRGFEWHYLWRCCHLAKPLSTSATKEAVRAVAFSPDGKWLAASEGRRIHLWNVETQAHTRTLEGHQFQVMTLAWNPSGTTLVSGSVNPKEIPGELLIWDTTKWTPQPLESNGDDVMQAVFSPDGTRLFVAMVAADSGFGSPSARYFGFKGTLGGW